MPRVITPEILNAVNTAFNASWKSGFGGATTYYNQLCMMTKSQTTEEVYAWLGRRLISAQPEAA